VGYVNRKSGKDEIVVDSIQIIVNVEEGVNTLEGEVRYTKF